MCVCVEGEIQELWKEFGEEHAASRVSRHNSMCNGRFIAPNQVGIKHRELDCIACQLDMRMTAMLSKSHWKWRILQFS